MPTKNTLTPTELFDYRLASLLGFADIDAMKASMSWRSYAGWRRYWDAEPWGAWRDNMHAAVIAREVRRTTGRGSAPKLDVFMLRDPTARAVEMGGKVWSALGAMATAVTPEEASRRMKDRRGKATNRRRRKDR